MKFTLNTDQTIIYVAGRYQFTMGESTHDIDPNHMTAEEKAQLLYGIKTNVILADSEVVSVLQPEDKPQYTTPQEVPVVIPQKSIEDTLQEDLKELRAILEGNTASVKKKSALMRVGRLRKLLELESEGKKRKGVISFLNEVIEHHTGSVIEAVSDGSEDMQPQDVIQIKTLSTQLEDLVESEEEEITFKLPEDDSVDFTVINK